MHRRPGGRGLSQNGMPSPTRWPTEGPSSARLHLCSLVQINPLAASLASAACGVDRFGVPSLPPFCPRCPGSWVLGPDVLASAGPHTLPEHPSLADPSGLQCIYSTPNANTHEVSSNDDTSMPAWAMGGYSPPSMAALPQGMIPELWSLTAASRIRQSIVH